MRHVVFIILLSFPIALVGWVVLRGLSGAPPERLGLEGPPASSISEARTKSATATDTRDAAPEAGPALAALFGGPLGGAKLSGALELYDPVKLYDYIDGAAPLYLERKFRLLGAAELTGPSGGELTCDIYDMTDAEHAESIAAKERSPTATPVSGWSEAWTGPMSFVFQRDRFYVKLTAFDAKAEVVLPELARALAERMR